MSEEFDHSKATTIFVLGLIGVVACQLTAPFAVIMGRNYRAECAAAGVEPEGLGTAGFVLGIIGSILMVLVGCLLMLEFVLIFFLVLSGNM